MDLSDLALGVCCGMGRHGLSIALVGSLAVGALGSASVHLALGHADLSAKGGIYFDYVEVFVCIVGVVFPVLIAG